MRNRPKIQLGKSKDGHLSMSVVGGDSKNQLLNNVKKTGQKRFTKNISKIKKMIYDNPITTFKRKPTNISGSQLSSKLITPDSAINPNIGAYKNTGFEIITKTKRRKVDQKPEKSAHSNFKKNYLHKASLSISGLGVALLAYSAVNVVRTPDGSLNGPSKSSSSEAKVQGQNTDKSNASQNQNAQANDSLPLDSINYKLVFPPGKTLNSYVKKVVRKSPSGSIIVSFVDKLGSDEFGVTEQQMPDKFKSDPSGELSKIAKDFQANSVIEIDGQKVFHGFSEKAHVQTLIMIKKDLLIFITSNKELEDSRWVGYISTLK